MKKYFALFIGVALFFISLFAVKHTIAQEDVQQVLDIACIADDIPSFKDCVKQVQDGTTDFIKITEILECNSQDDCAVRLSDIKRTVLIYGATNTGSGFKRLHSFDYAIITIQNSEKVSIGGFLIDDSAADFCPSCPPAILIQNAKQTNIESLHTKLTPNTAVLITGSDRTIIKKSFFDTSRIHAVAIKTSSNTTIENNTFKNSWANGVIMESSGTNSIRQNAFSHNHRKSVLPDCGSVCTAAQLAIMPNSGTVILMKNTIQDGSIDTYGAFGLTTSGIEISGQGTEHVTLSCNIITQNTGNGIVLTNRSDTLKTFNVTKNTFTINGIDVNIPVASSDTITDNCFTASCKVEGC